MKRWVIACQCIVAAALAAISPAVSGQSAAEPGAEHPAVRYEADVQVKPKERRVTGWVTARFVPPDPDKAYFHLYPNAFRENASLNDPNWEYVLGNQREAGGIAVRRVAVAGRSVPFAVRDTILEVPLAPVVPAGAWAEVRIEFDLTVPKNNGRLSYDEHALWLGNWLPILAVKDAAGWRLDPYYPMGDPFYSDVADYRVRVRVPAGYQVASSGSDQAAAVERLPADGEVAVSINAPRVRDFAVVVMDGTYRVKTSQAGGTLLRTWWQQGDDEEQAAFLHDAARQSLAYYGRAFGPYPYAEYDVVKTGGFFGGMEYPGLVFIQGEYFHEPRLDGVVVVAHETAHQWFYALVGNDEVREAWVDESLTDYATMSFLHEYAPLVAGDYIDRRSRRAALAAEYARAGLVVWQPLDKFPDWKSYSDLVYSRGATMLWELRQAWGEREVNRVLREYVQAHRFGQATGADVVRAFSRAAGADATPFFDYWLQLDNGKEQQAKAWLEAGKRNVHRQ